MDTIAVDTDARGVARLMLNRPDKHNALSAPMMAEVTAAAQSLGADRAVRVVVLTGAGDSFCAGGDLAWMQAQMQADTATRAAGARQLAMMLRALNDLPKPLIGRVQGAAYGGGVGMLSVCDVAIGVDSARFGLTETRLGLIPATIGPYVVARMGEAAARQVFFSSRLFGAAEALRINLLSQVVTPDALDAAVEAEIATVLACAPGAVAAAKAMVRSLGAPLDDTVIEASIAALVARWDAPEAAEGIDAFFAGRKPAWAV